MGRRWWFMVCRLICRGRVYCMFQMRLLSGCFSSFGGRRPGGFGCSAVQVQIVIALFFRLYLVLCLALGLF